VGLTIRKVEGLAALVIRDLNIVVLLNERTKRKRIIKKIKIWGKFYNKMGGR
jgi:hypothetical protein